MNEDKSTRYRRLQRRASLCSAASAAIALFLFLISGGSAAFRDALGGSSWLALLPFTVVLVVVIEVLQAPFAYYKGVTLERRYGLSAQTAAQWTVDHVRAAQVGLVLALIAASILWVSMRLLPGAWWLAAAGAAVVVLALVARAAPVLLLPLFYDFTPLDRPALVARIQALAARAGVPVIGVYTWRMADKTRKANAALAGLGATRRILISDTLLAEHSDDEIEVVLAHELAHHVHRDLWSSLAMEGLLLAAGFYAADRVMDRATGVFGLMGKTDIAALPLLVLSAAAVMVLLRPFANALSRRHERRADRYALDATGNTAAFISAMKRLGAQNLAEEQPPRLVELLFYTHPPMARRIEAARKFGTVAVLLLALAGTACDVQVAKDGNVSLGVSEGTAKDEWTRTYTLAAGGVLEIVNTIGGIDVRAATGPDVRVTGARVLAMGDTDLAQAELKKLQMVEEVAPGRVRVQTPSRNDEAGRPDRRGFLAVEYTVEVPPGLMIRLKTERGDVNIKDVHGAISVETSHAGISVHRLAGSLEARTVNGSINVDIAALTGDLTLGAVNGGVSVIVPKDIDADVQLSAVNGGVSVDDGLRLTTTQKEPQRLTGRLNKGGPKIAVDVVNAGVRVSAD